MSETRRYRIFIHLAAVLVALIFLAPFAWLAIASVSSPVELLRVPLKWIPSHVSFSRYEQIFSSTGENIFANFRAAWVNSLIVAGATVVISMTIGVFGAYAFARLRFKGARAALLLFLSTYMVPPIALVIPMYLIMVKLHLLDNKLGLIIVYCSFATPFVLWIMGNYFQTIPRELEDAARVDGCTRIGALFRVILPLARPGLLSTMLFAFLIAWDEFLYALIFTSTNASKTIPVAIAEFTGRYTTDFGLQAAGGILAALPPVLIAVIFQRYIVGGLSAGAVKGVSEEQALSFHEGVLAQPENLREAAALLADALAGADLAALREGTIVFSGIGASWHALLPAVRALRRAGRRAFAVPAPELAAARGLADTYVLVSQSGASTEILDARRALEGERVLALSAKADSPLVAAAESWLPLSARTDTPVSTLSYTATLQALGMLAEQLSGAGPGTDWTRVAELSDESLQRHRPGAEVLAEQLAGAQVLDAVAAAPALASAGETALLGREALHLPAAHEETRQYLHGPLESVREGFACVLFGGARELELAGALSGYGAASCVITAEDGPTPFGAHTIRIDPCSELAAPILQILPVQLAVAAAASTLGLPVRELARHQADTKLEA